LADASCNSCAASSRTTRFGLFRCCRQSPPANDFRSEFAIRGAGVRQMNFTFEGISPRLFC
jgi:hypothetical protein